jgi:hypothetical protein
LCAVNEDEQRADVFQWRAAARGSITSLMAELMEDHIRNHMPRNSKSSEEAADDLVGIVRSVSFIKVFLTAGRRVLAPSTFPRDVKTKLDKARCEHPRLHLATNDTTTQEVVTFL